MHRGFTVLAALATAVPLGVLAPFGTAARAASVPSDVAAATLVRHVVTDVDGDGTPDQVTLNYLGARQFELAVATKGTSATVRFTSYVDTDEAPASDTWYGASAIDGHAGSELVVNRFTASSAANRDNVAVGVYTWRSGKLVAEKAPAAPWGRAWVVNASGSSQARGYRFFTSNSHRYVDATRLTEGNTRWTGTVTRSVWRHGEWVKVSTRRAAPVADPAWKATGIAGPKLLQGQLSADVDGDGTADLVAAYRTGSAHYLVRVSTGTRKVEKTLSAVVDPPFLGAAQLDGIAGVELMFIVDPDDPGWKVLTWRGGQLAYLPSPPLAGEAGNRTQWWGASDESVTNFAFTIENGVAYATVGDTASEDWPSGDVEFARSAYQSGKWVRTQPDWTQSGLTAEQVKIFHSGFTAADLIAP